MYIFIPFLPMCRMSFFGKLFQTRLRVSLECVIGKCCGCVLRVLCICEDKKVQVGKGQEKALSEKDSHSKNRGGKKLN